MCNHQINTFCCKQDEWDTKDNNGKSIKNALYVYTAPCQKISLPEAVKKKKQGIRQAISY